MKPTIGDFRGDVEEDFRGDFGGDLKKTLWETEG